jgi:heterodisulfide reductase subunit A-like polyferredoxin
MQTPQPGPNRQSQTVVVVGGGIAGICAALETAETGQEVVLLEKGPSLGGRVAGLINSFPESIGKLDPNPMKGF